MSATNFTPIQLYRTSTAAAAPTAGNLAAGELAINLTDEKLYFKNAAGVVKLLASNSGALGTVTSVDVSGGTTGLTTSGGPITSSGTITLAGTLGVANGGTGTATAFTAGSVVFAGASGVYSQNNANLFWDNTNNRLGIGTATPLSALDVIGNIRIPSGNSLYWAGGNELINAVENNRMTFFVAGSERMRIDSSGNVGIGTVSPADRLSIVTDATLGFRLTQYNNSDGAVLRLLSARGTNASPTAITTDSVIFGLRGFGYSSAGSFSAASVASINALAAENFTATAQGTYFQFLTTAVGTTNALERMRITSAGDVGIGTSSPARTLSVYSTSSIPAQIESSGADARISIFTSSGSGGQGFVQASSGALLLGSSNSERMRIDASGNVGIGTSSPADRLHVSATGTAYGSGYIVSRHMNAVSEKGVFLGYDADENAGTIGGANFLTFQTYNAANTWGERMRIDREGNVGIGTSSPVSRLNVSGTTGFTWPDGGGTSSGLVTIGTQGTGGSLFVNTASLNAGFASGLAIDGTYSGPSSVVNIKAVGVKSGGGYNASLAFHTSSETTLTERMRIDSSGNVGIGTASPSSFTPSTLVVQAATTAGITISESTGGGTASIAFSATSSFQNRAKINCTMSTQSLEFSAAGSERMRIDSSGNVGIGTSSPGAKLDVATASGDCIIRVGNGTSQARFAVDNDGPYIYPLTSGDTSLRVFTPVGSEAMRIDSAGNVGIGVTPTTGGYGRGIQISGDPASDLGTLWMQAINTNDHRVSLTNNAKNSGVGTWSYFASNQSATMYEQVSGIHRWFTAPTGTAGAAISFTQAMTLTSGSTLELKGANAGLLLDRRDNNNNAYQIYSAAGALQFYSYTSGADAMTIDASGNVGIGVTPTTNRLVMARGQYLAWQNTGTLAETSGITADTSDNMIFSNNGSERARIDASGNFVVGASSAGGEGGLTTRPNDSAGAATLTWNRANTASTTYAAIFRNANADSGTISYTNTATSYNTSSDARLKHDIVAAPEASSLIDAIQVRSFKWNADNSHQRYGMVAQELAAVAPEAVSQPADPDDMMGVDYSKLVPMLVKEIQSMRLRLAQLEGN